MPFNKLIRSHSHQLNPKNRISTSIFHSVFFFKSKLFQKFYSTAVKFRYLHVRNLLKKLLNFYIKSSIHVALAVLALAKISLLSTAADQEYTLLIFIFFSALSAYNFIKFFPFFKSQKFSFSTALIPLLTLIAFLISGAVIFLLPSLVVAFALLGGFLALGYAVPFQSTLSNWRSKKGWKMYLVVLSWLCLTVGVPLASAELFDAALFFKLGLVQGIYIFVAILPFEIGDLNSDAATLQTLPKTLGVKRVKILGILLLLFGSVIAVLSFGFASPFVKSSLITFFILGLSLWRSNKNQSAFFARFWVEGIPILWCILIYYF